MVGGLRCRVCGLGLGLRVFKEDWILYFHVLVFYKQKRFWLLDEGFRSFVVVSLCTD